MWNVGKGVQVHLIKVLGIVILYLASVAVLLAVVLPIGAVLRLPRPLLCCIAAAALLGGAAHYLGLSRWAIFALVVVVLGVSPYPWPEKQEALTGSNPRTFLTLVVFLG